MPRRTATNLTHGLTIQQERFVQEYLKPGTSATQAALAAGSAPKHAGQVASNWLKRPHIRLRLERLAALRAERAEITADRVLAEWTRIAFADIRDVVTWTPDGVHLTPSADLTATAAATIRDVREQRDKDGNTTSLSVRMHDKVKALEMLSRHLNLIGDDGKGDGGDEVDRFLAALGRRLMAKVIEVEFTQVPVPAPQLTEDGPTGAAADLGNGADGGAR